MPRIAHYKLDGTGNNALSGTYGLDGSLTNSPTFVNNRFDRPNEAMQLIDNNSGVVVADNSLFDFPNTWSFWMKPSRVPTGPDFILTKHASSFSVGWGIYIDQFMQIAMLFKTASAVENSFGSGVDVVSVGVWTKVSFQITGTQAKIWIDNVLKNTLNFSFTLSNNTNPVTIGYSPDSFWGDDYKGDIDDVILANELVDPSLLKGSVEFSGTPLTGAAPQSVQFTSEAD